MSRLQTTVSDLIWHDLRSLLAVTSRLQDQPSKNFHQKLRKAIYTYAEDVATDDPNFSQNLKELLDG